MPSCFFYLYKLLFMHHLEQTRFIVFTLIIETNYPENSSGWVVQEDFCEERVKATPADYAGRTVWWNSRVRENVGRTINTVQLYNEGKPVIKVNLNARPKQVTPDT